MPVGILTAYLREILENDALLSDLWVEGEVSGLSRAASGHLYFTLRDGDGQIRCALFRGNAARQHHLPENGQQVAVHGGLSFYPQRGSTEIIVDLVLPAGLGLAALELARLARQLENEGLFDASRKRPLPAMPKVIGVVTSPDGAVWHDIQHVVGRRYPLAELVLSPCTVQGDRAPDSIVAAINALDDEGTCDLIIVARGGGSPEDLAAFNDERVVRAIFAASVPVVAGIGHETDVTLADHVADLRAPTPSAAAELAVPSRVELAAALSEQRRQLDRLLVAGVRGRLSEFNAVLRRLERSSPQPTLSRLAEHVTARRQLASRLTDTAIMSAAHRLAARVGMLAALEPAGVLRRGYAVLADAESGQPIAGVGDTARGREFIADLHDGALFGRIESITRVGAAR